MALRGTTARWRSLPDFVIVGAQKAGTTSLYRYLCQHQRIEPAVLKETRHFDLTPDRGASAYRAYFPVRRSGRVTGEATPEYLHFPWVPHALRTVAPDTRIIVLLRDPVERAFSHYRHSVARGEEHLDFEAALEAEPARLGSGPGRPNSPEALRYSRYSYATRGRYAQQLRRWYAAFPEDQVLVLMFDRLSDDPQAVVDDTTRFLGLPTFRLRDTARHNASAPQSMPRALRHQLREFFEPHDRELTGLLGVAPSWVDQSE